MHSCAWKVFLIATQAAMLLAACNGTGDTRAPSAVASDTAAGRVEIGVDACTLMTKDEAEAILGTIIGEPSRYQDQSRSMCTFVVAAGDTTIRVDYPVEGRRATTGGIDDEVESSARPSAPHFVSANGYLLSVESPSPATANAVAAKAAGRLP